jgi:creatinine amidohydrolase
MKLGEMRWPEVKALDKSKCVVLIPVGSMEQHGPHLPLQVDHYIVTRFAEDLEKRISELIVLPPVWAGVSAHHMDFPGTVTIRPNIFIEALRDVCVSLYHHGFRRFVLLNGHGGNRASLEVLGQELYASHGLSIMTIFYGQLVPAASEAVRKTTPKGTSNHAGEGETSLMLYLAPHLVSEKNIPKGVLVPSDEKRKLLHAPGLKRYVNIKEYSDVGVNGRPEAGNREDGATLYRATLDELERVIRGMQRLSS